MDSENNFVNLVEEVYWETIEEDTRKDVYIER